MPKQTLESGQPNCHKCRHFFITYEPDHPYGCRAMGFKSIRLPSVTVKLSSGLNCQLFELKHRLKD